MKLKTHNNKKIVCCIQGTLIALTLSLTSFAQNDASKVDTVQTLSLYELMNIPIQSASKKNETLFEAPLSSYTITAREIERSGATSIPDALKLAPGVIVREQSNGTYDVAIRGLDNLTQGGTIYSASNLSTLVMVDNRPIFNHNLGGVFWETIPVDLADIDRIEIVRGPSAPLFGPNAVSGVINIITKQLKAATSTGTVRIIGALPSAQIASAYMSNRFSDNLSVNLSANYQTRQRWDDSENIIATPTGTAIIKTKEVPEAIKKNFPDINQSLKRYGFNAGFNFKKGNNIHIAFTTGLQNSGAQKLFVATSGTNLGWNETVSGYANLASQVGHFNFRGSYWVGKEDLSYNSAPGRYDFNITDMAAEYEFKIGNVATIVPGISYVNTVFDDRDYADEEETYFAGRKSFIDTKSAFMRTDWKLTDSWRLLAALRIDKFSLPDDAYLAYELASTYSINEKNLLRFALTRSNSGSFVGETSYLDFTTQGFTSVKGSVEQKQFTVDMIELGFRSKPGDKFQFDLDIFAQKADNLSAYLVDEFVEIAPGVFVPSMVNRHNIDAYAKQIGATLSINFVANEKFQLKPFITLQRTKLYDRPSAYVNPDIDPSITFDDVNHKSSPTIFGGWYANYQSGKLSINLNGYYFSKMDIYNANLNMLSNVDPSVPKDNDGKLILNTRVGYALSQTFSAFVFGRNILNKESREFSYADRISALYGIGINWDF